ncbi:type VI secretion system accessory protein TagJ [Sphingomonas sp. DT-51]|uniref:type VI secretion system accessory protein TagJ n=1 Tax=Sphingomonas sp. DT-51 TaxID=3396165 RepID=UPI003F1A1D7C
MIGNAKDLEATIGLQVRSGDIAGAIERLREGLRDRPDDQRARMFLFQLHCINGVWDKARAQLRALAQLSPEAQMLAVAYNKTIDGEIVRDLACGGVDPAELLHASPIWAVDLANAFAAGADEAAEMRARAFDASPDTPGEVDGQPFDYIFDGDGRFGPAFEAIVGGRWGLLPFCAVEEIKTDGPIDLRDLVWLPAEVRLRDGGSVAALLPARYPGAAAEEDAQLRLAQRTEWREGDTVVRGAGQRVWTLSNGDDVGILSFRQIRFSPPS